jgi:hypothetical protein
MALYLHLQICVHNLHGYKLTFLTCFINNPIIKLCAGNIFNSFYQLHKPGMFLNKRHTTFNNNNNNTHTSECTNVKIQIPYIKFISNKIIIITITIVSNLALLENIFYRDSKM